MSRKGKVASFLAAIELDIYNVVKLVNKHNLRVRTIYIGGVTPISLETDDLRRLINFVEQAFSTTEICEFTVEAGRPDSLNPKKIAVLSEAIVNHISINPQKI